MCRTYCGAVSQIERSREVSARDERGRERETGERRGQGGEGWRGLQGAADSRSARGAAT